MSSSVITFDGVVSFVASLTGQLLADLVT